MSSIGHALVNLFTVSTVLYWHQRENTAHLGKYKQIQQECINGGMDYWNSGILQWWNGFF